MSYFSEIYGDPELSAKAKLVLLYLCLLYTSPSPRDS